VHKTPGKIPSQQPLSTLNPPKWPKSGPTACLEHRSRDGLLSEGALGRVHRYRTVTIYVSETTLAIELDDGETRVVRRTTTQPVRNIKADRPRTVPSVS